MGIRVNPWLKPNLYSAGGFDFVAAFFRLRGRFRGFAAADALRWRRFLRSLRSCFSCRYAWNFL